MSTLQINVLGTSFTIKSNEDADYLNKLLKYYKGITDSLEAKGVLRDPLQVSIMAGIMMCDQLYQDKKAKVQIQNTIRNNTEEDMEIEKLIAEFISKLDKAVL